MKNMTTREEKEETDRRNKYREIEREKRERERGEEGRGSEEEERRRRGERRSKCMARKNKNPTLRMWGISGYLCDALLVPYALSIINPCFPSP